MDNDNKQITSISIAFAKAVMARQDCDEAFEERFLTAAGDDAFDMIGAMFVLPEIKKDLGANSPEYTEAVVTLADQFAAACSKFCTSAELKTLLPKEVSPGVAETFESSGAKNMAKICRL